MEHTKTTQNGFTLIEILISIVIITVLLALGSVNFGKGIATANLTTVTDKLLADIKSQQLLAMAGGVGSATPAQPHGILFGSQQYTLFIGSTFKAGDGNNFAVAVPQSVTFSTTLPSNQLRFNTGDGAVSSYVNGQDSVTISAAGDTSTITINRLGATVLH